MKNLEKLNHEEYFILLNDFPKFKNEAQISLNRKNNGIVQGI